MYSRISGAECVNTALEPLRLADYDGADGQDNVARLHRWDLCKGRRGGRVQEERARL